MLTLKQVQAMYPKTRINRALTGYIPMPIYVALEPFIRPLLKKNRLQVFYRGPRIANNLARHADWPPFNKYSASMRPSKTVRCDATHAVLYPGS
jgi:hypothetical protein